MIYFDLYELGINVAGALKYLPINKERIMQFTSLKDKNEKEIYEGDIFKEGYYDEGKPILYIVEWREKDASFGWKQIVPVLTEGFEIKDVEIIGNIYENRELIK